MLGFVQMTLLLVNLAGVEIAIGQNTRAAVEEHCTYSYYLPTLDNSCGETGKRNTNEIDKLKQEVEILKTTSSGLKDQIVFLSYCDLKTSRGEWLVFQRRGFDGKEIFFRSWNDYKNGFGDATKEYWLGNEVIYRLTSQKIYKLRIDLEDFEGNKRYAEYSQFSIGSSETNYRLSVAGYSGDAGDSLTFHNGQQFSTKDADHDADKNRNCASDFKGGWWYAGCHRSNLNGAYLRGKHSSYAAGIEWDSWTGYYYSLKSTEMKIAVK